MSGVIVGGATLALVTTSEIQVLGVVFRGSTVNYPSSVVVGPVAVLNLSNKSIASTAATGALVGNFSVTGGTGVYTFSLTSNPGNLFQVVGTSLLSSTSPLSPGSDPITAKADNGAGSVIITPFIITVPASTGNLPSLDFSNGTLNSQNLIVVMGI